MHRTIKEGINGSGRPIYLVVTMDNNGNAIWIERFESKPEAQNWLHWS